MVIARNVNVNQMFEEQSALMIRNNKIKTIRKAWTSSGFVVTNDILQKLEELELEEKSNQRKINEMARTLRLQKA